MPAPSPTATLYRDALANLKTKLDAERSGGQLWLAAAKEVMVGLHAQEASFQDTGVYLLPVRAASVDEETVGSADYLRVRIVCMHRTLKADTDQAAPATFTLIDLIGGVVDVVKANRSLTSGLVLVLASNEDEITSNIETVPRDDETVYRAFVEVIVRGETS